MEYKILRRLIISSVLLAPISYAQIAGDSGGATPRIGSNPGMTSNG